MRWNIKRSKLLFALIPIMSIVFYIFTADPSLYADQSFVAFDIYQQISTVKVAAPDTIPADYSAADNYAIASGVYLNAYSVQSETNGTVTAMGFYKQTVMNYRSRIGKELFNESVSLSAIASVAEERYFKDGALLWRSGKASGNSVKSWSTDIVELDPAVYRQRYGVVPLEITKYSVTEQSVISETKISDNADGTHTYELVLDADEAQKYARYEMMTYAGVSTFPDFYSCRLQFTIDDNWRILEVSAFDTYKIDLMGGVKCESRMTETFTYGEESMPERAQIFIDYVPTGNHGTVVVEKGPADYLGEAFGDYISGARNLCLQAELTVNDIPLSVTGSVDLIGGEYRFAINNGIYAVYKGTTLYLDTAGGKYKIDTADIPAFISSLPFGSSGKNDSDASISDAFSADGDILATLFENYELDETDDAIRIYMPFSLMGLDIEVDMGLAKTGEGVLASTVSADVARGEGFTLHAEVEFKDSVELPEFVPADYEDLSPALDAIAATVNLDAYRSEGTVEILYGENTVPVYTDLAIYKTADGADIDGVISAGGISLSVKYAGGYVYLRSGGISLKAAVSDFGELAAFIGKLMPADADIRAALEEVLARLVSAKPDVNSLLGILSYVHYGDGKLTVTVPAKDKNITAELTHGDILDSLKVSVPEINGYGVKAHFTLGKAQPAEVEIPSDAVDVRDIEKFVPALGKLADAQSYALDISGSVSVQGRTLPLSADITLDRASLGFNADVKVGDIPAKLAYADSAVYAIIGNFAAKLATQDAMLLLNRLTDLETEAILDAIAANLPVSPDTVPDINAILSAIDLEYSAPALTLRVNLSEGVTAEISLALSGEDVIAEISVVSDGFTVTANAKVTGNPYAYSPAPAPAEYRDGAEIIPLIDPIVNTLRAGTFDLRISDGRIYTADASESFELYLTAKLPDDESGFEISGNFTVSGTEAGFGYRNQTVYVSAGEINLKANVNDKQSLDSLLSFLTQIGIEFPEFDSGKLSEILQKADTLLPAFDLDGITSLLGAVTVNGNTVSLTVTPEAGADYSYTVVLAFGDEYAESVSIKGPSILGYTADITANLKCNLPFDSGITDSDYSDAADLVKILPALEKMINAGGYAVSISDSSVSTPFISGALSGNIYVSREPVGLGATLRLRDMHDIDVQYINDCVYMRINGIKLKFTKDELDEFKTEITAYAGKLGLTDDQAVALAETAEELTEQASIISSYLGGRTLGEILDCVTYFSVDRGGVITVNFLMDSFSGKAEISALPDGELKVVLSQLCYDEMGGEFTVAVTAAQSVSVSAPSDAETYVSLGDLQSYIRPVMQSAEKDCYRLTFDGSTVYDSLGALTTIDGELKIDRTQGLKAYVYIKLGGKTGNQSLKLYLVNDDAALPRENYRAVIDVNGFTASIDYVHAVKILGEFCEILDLDIPVVKELTETLYVPTGTTVFETMDIVGLNGLRDMLDSLFATAEDVSGTASGSSGLLGITGLISDSAVDKALKGVTVQVDGGLLKLNIDNAIFDIANAGKDPAVVTIGKSEDGNFISYIDIANIVARGDTVNYTALVTCSDGFDEADEIVLPESVKCDLAGMEDFLYTILKTADLRNFNIKGTIQAKVTLFGIDAVNIGIDFEANVKILADGSTVAAIKLAVPYQAAVLTKTDSYIYFVNNRLYFIVDEYKLSWFTNKYNKTESKSATIDEFLANPVDYILYLVRMSSLLDSGIRSAITDSSMTIDPKQALADIDSIIKSCVLSEDGTFTLTADLNKLTGNGSFSDITIGIGTEDNYVRSLSLTTSIASVVHLNIINTKLTLGTDSDGNTIAPELPAVDFGESHKNDKSLTKNIDNLEDDMALLFPVEGAETLADKANDKAEKANSAAKAAKASVPKVTECVNNLEDATKEYETAKENLEASVPGKLGYKRNLAKLEAAAIALARAKNELDAAEAARIELALAAYEAATVAQAYSVKASNAANAISSNTDARYAAAYGAASIAAANALEAAKSALSEAKDAIESAVEYRTALLRSAQSEYDAALRRLDKLADSQDVTAAEEAQKAADTTKEKVAAAQKKLDEAKKAEKTIKSFTV